MKLNVFEFKYTVPVDDLNSVVIFYNSGHFYCKKVSNSCHQAKNLCLKCLSIYCSLYQGNFS